MKESTRQVILDTSRTLFNERGVYGVTLRQIAAKVGISQGNLNYHFTRKEDIIKELFYQFTSELSNEFTATTKLGPNFYFIIELARKTFEGQTKYKFLIMDLNYLVNDIPELEIHVAEVMKQRIEQFNQMFKVFIEKSYMRKAEFQSEYEELGQRLYLLGVYSIIPVLNQFKGNKDKQLECYLQIILTACYPYLTKVGKQRFFEALEDNKLKFN